MIKYKVSLNTNMIWNKKLLYEKQTEKVINSL